MGGEGREGGDEALQSEWLMWEGKGAKEGIRHCSLSDLASLGHGPRLLLPLMTLFMLAVTDGVINDKVDGNEAARELVDYRFHNQPGSGAGERGGERTLPPGSCKKPLTCNSPNSAQVMMFAARRKKRRWWRNDPRL